MQDGFERLYIAPETVPCDGGAGPQTCLQVRRVPGAPWELFYDDIEGFEFEPGYRYEIVVRVAEIPEPAADASSLRFTLVEVVEKAPAD